MFSFAWLVFFITLQRPIEQLFIRSGTQACACTCFFIKHFLTLKQQEYEENFTFHHGADSFPCVGGVNAQTRALSEGQEYLPAHGTVTETTGDATKIQGYDEDYNFLHSIVDMDMDAVFARFTTEDLEKYIGYKVVGISVAGEFGQTNVDFMLNILCNQEFNGKVQKSSKNVAIAKGVKATPSVNGMKLYTWNDVMFEKPYTIPAKVATAEEGDPNNFQDLYAGYWIKDADGKIVTSQLLVGQYYSDVIEDGQHVEPGTYVQQTGSSTKVPHLVGMFPGLLPVKLILEKTSTSINSTTTTTTAKETGRYTMDGKRVYLPVRGINIVKMSDGTVRKVMKK